MAKKVVERMDGKAIVITGGAGPMTTAIAIRDASSFLRDLVKDPENADRLLDFCVDCNLKWIEYNQKVFGKVVVSMADPATSTNLLSAIMPAGRTASITRKRTAKAVLFAC